MAWVQNNSGGDSQLKPLWEYRKGCTPFITILPNTVRKLVLITDDNDPTKTWDSPLSVWVHQFKAQKGGFNTLICNRFAEACPCCFENEIMRAKFPNEKIINQKLPYPVSLKALVQVYDIQYQKVHWLLASKKIIDGIEFIYADPNQLAVFKGIINIQRIGEKLNTNYAVFSDGAAYNLTAQDLDIIKQQTITKSDAQDLFMATAEDYQEKMGIDVCQYFDKNIPSHPEVDISTWGAVPRGCIKPIDSLPLGNSVQQPNPAIVNQQHQQGVTSNDDPVFRIMTSQCSTGMYANKTFAEILRVAGTTYLQYLVVNGITENDKTNAKYILDNLPGCTAWNDLHGGAF